MLRIAKGIARFWYDFIIGDDWKIAAAVVTVLTIGAALVSTEIGVHGDLLVPLLAAGIATAFTLSLLVDVHRHGR